MNRKACLIFSAASLLIMLLVFGAIAINLGRFLTSTDPLSPADAIVVLSGDSCNFDRARHAVRLFHQGYAPRVVFIGASAQDAGWACTSAQQSLEFAQRLGLPVGAAIIIAGPRSTHDEALALHRLTRQYEWHSLIVVTHPFHSRRAGRTFRTLLSDVIIYVSAVPDPHYDADRWWQTEDSLVTVFSEVIKLAFYWAKYGIAPVG